MTKSELIDLLHKQLSDKHQALRHAGSETGGPTRADCEQSVSIILEEIKEALEQEEQVKISGFGTFEVRRKEARRGRNPQTGEPLMIDARKVLRFRPSALLRDRLAGTDSGQGGSE